MTPWDRLLADLGLDPTTLANAREQAAHAHQDTALALTRAADQVCQAITPHVQEALRTSGVPDPTSYHVTYTAQEIPHAR